MMTAAQAQEKAAVMHEQNIPHSKIAKALAKEGYLSFKTGKALCPGAISRLVRNFKSGHVPVDSPVIKYATKAAPRKTIKESKPAERRSSPAQMTTVWDIARLIDESNVFKTTTKKALLDLIVTEATRI